MYHDTMLFLWMSIIIQKETLYFNFLLRYCWFIILKYFEACPTTSIHTHLILLNKCSTSMVAYLHAKINLIPTHIFEKLLIYHFEVLWACPTMSVHTYLTFMNQFAVSMDTYPHTKNEPHAYTWDLADLSFWSILGIPNHAGPQPPNVYGSIRLRRLLILKIFSISKYINIKQYKKF